MVKKKKCGHPIRSGKIGVWPRSGHGWLFCGLISHQELLTVAWHSLHALSLHLHLNGTPSTIDITCTHVNRILHAANGNLVLNHHGTLLLMLVHYHVASQDILLGRHFRSLFEIGPICMHGTETQLIAAETSLKSTQGELHVCIYASTNLAPALFLISFLSIAWLLAARFTACV